ncbi:hypothetical protein KDM87_04180 [Undibacterium sp. FT147W]|uniref:Glycosylase n=1 Tax=Undibacterium rivi TaxID=2828729 RepID=A0ABS5GZ96_9BURK|nr:hypothetical protein [Undibacterium rivi]MBR7791783.1 hypothetical protein [Undibacterium rivi]
MRWRKLGKIFDPTQHHVVDNGIGFAQSPQTLIFDDFVRIYFSTRVEDASGKFLSKIAFVDMDKTLSTVLRISSDDVIAPGKLGCFDEHGIFPMNVLRVGKEIYAYTCGWSRRVAVSVETGIGIAISRDDGLTFQRVGDGPILSSSLHEACLIGDGFVLKNNDQFHMWYIFGRNWKRYSDSAAPERIYKIGHAVSDDGINWHKDGGHQIIPDILGEDECQALPTVLQIASRYHMFFCYREATDFRTNKARGYRLGHAWSDDLQTWERDDQACPLPGAAGEWDSDMQCYPHIFQCDEKIYLAYNGNQFGKFGFGIAQLEL